MTRRSTAACTWSEEVLGRAHDFAAGLADDWGLSYPSLCFLAATLFTAAFIAVDFVVFAAAASRTKRLHGARSDASTAAPKPSNGHTSTSAAAAAVGSALAKEKINMPSAVVTAAATPEHSCGDDATAQNGKTACVAADVPEVQYLPLDGPKYTSVAAMAAALAIALALWSRGLRRLARIAALGGLSVRAVPYLCKASIYRRDKRLRCKLGPLDKRRSWGDMLVWTSLIYMAPAIYGLHAHQYGIAVLQALTSMGSTLFHLTRETMCFNLDNIFAQSLLLTTLWGGILAGWTCVWAYVGLLLAGLPLAAYFLVGCGMPGLICCHPGGKECGLVRRSNPDYDFFHMCWHIVSGLGTLASIHFFELYFPDKEAGGGWFAHFPDLPVVPTVSLVISAMANLAANLSGVLPVA